MYSIAFICSANACRSPMAHAIFAAEAAKRKLPVRVVSAGTWDFGGMPAVREAQLVCQRHHTPMTKLLSTHLTQVDLSQATRIFCMERAHLTTLVEAGVPLDRIRLLGEFDPQQRGPEIDDPMGQNVEAFEQCYQRLRDCIVHYLNTTADFGAAS